MATVARLAPAPPDTRRSDAEMSAWLLDSGVQAPAGHFFAWLDLESDSFVRPYPEITGYGISYLCWLHDSTGECGLLDRARRAVRFLVEEAVDPVWGLVGDRRLTPLRALTGPAYLHAFDSGIAATALERLAARAPEAELLRARDRMAASYLRHLPRGDGTIWPLVDLEAGRPAAGNAKWSQRFSGYLLKSLMFLMLRGSPRGGSEEASILRRTVERVLSEQQPCGAFPSYPGGETHLHPHLYTLEALAVASATGGDPEWLDRVAAGYRYLERLLELGWGLPTRADRYRVTVPFERADIVAQFLRVGSYLCGAGCIGRGSLDSSLLWARRRLQRYVVGAGRHGGGVLFGRDWDGSAKRHLNSGVTIFAAQACSWFEAARDGARPDPRRLI